MKNLDGRILLSASDLMRFTGCSHATTMDLAYSQRRGPTPREDSDDAALLQRLGNVHEATHLQRLKDGGRSVIEIDRDTLEKSSAATRAALTAGSEVIFQGAFSSENWGGWSDFLERGERPSALGVFSYEVTDTKLK